MGRMKSIGRAGLRLDVESTAKAGREEAERPSCPEHRRKSLLVQRILSKDPGRIDAAAGGAQGSDAGANRELCGGGSPKARRGGSTGLSRFAGASCGDEAGESRGRLGRSDPEDARELNFSPEADARTLLRRASLTLTGLPPTPEEMAAWLADTFARGMGKTGGPAAGLAGLWRADGMGLDGGVPLRGLERLPGRQRPHDVAVARLGGEAFNRNMPWDEFTVWQLAGDLLPNATDEQKLATAFLRNHPINGEGGRIPKRTAWTMSSI